MSIFDQAASVIEQLSLRIPIGLYTLVASFIEEIIAPIPSPFVMTSAGSIAAAQGKTVAFLFLLALLGAVGKTLGSLVLYFIADKAEDTIVKKYGRFFGITHRELESIGKHFKGHWRDDFMLAGLRALPIIPSAPISIVCGIIKVPLRTYIVSTFTGTTIRNLLFLYFGYAGLGSYQTIVNGMESVESIVQVAMAVTIGLIIVWFYWKRHQRNIKLGKDT